MGRWEVLWGRWRREEVKGRAFLSFCMVLGEMFAVLFSMFVDVRRFSQICISAFPYFCLSACSLMFARRIAALFLIFADVRECSQICIYAFPQCYMFLIFAMIRSESVGGIWAGIAKRNKKRLSASDVPRYFFNGMNLP